jgi:hypothetical protein
MLSAVNAQAQDIYSAGYYNVNNGTIAALYKNNERLYTAHISGLSSKAIRVVCNSAGDVFWMVNHYNYSNNALNRIEIRKNNQVYATLENPDVIHINDMYCLEDTLYYAGYQLNENGVAIATVWKGENFATHWVLGDGHHTSVIFDADVDKSTNIPYYCGYVTDSIRHACVWKASELLYKHEPSGIQRASWANEISIDNESVYTNGYLNYDTGEETTISIGTIWKDNEQICYGSNDDFLDCLYAHQGDYYYAYYYPHGMYYAIYKNRNVILQLPSGQTGVLNILGEGDNIYMVGALEGKGSIWKNFEVCLQPNNCYALYDMVFFQTDGINNAPIDNGFTVYPNPANGVLFVETQNFASLLNQTEYRITNLMGQNLLQGHITAETQQINIGKLPAGMYLITIAGETRKFAVK